MSPRPILPTEEDYDDMHHALGRPARRTSETYRNHYCAPINHPMVERFERLGWWDRGRECSNNGELVFYHVNGAGKEALAKWLEKRKKDGTS